jgi:hypothetical protein
VTDIFIPGLGSVPFHVYTAQNAVTEYDEDLILGQSDHMGWVVFLKNGPQEGLPFPVLNLGHELPPAEEIKRRLYKGDTKRRGRQIVADIERNNAAARKRNRDAAHEGAAESAEVIEWAMRTAGHTSHKKILMAGAKK